MVTLFEIVFGIAACWFIFRYMKNDFEKTVSYTPVQLQVKKTNETVEEQAKVETPATLNQNKTIENKKHRSKPEDFMRLSGIGPKIAAFLKNNEIHSYRQLAEFDVLKLTALLKEAGIRARNSDPSMWTKQAKLAAEADWEGLNKFQRKQKHERIGKVKAVA